MYNHPEQLIEPSRARNRRLALRALSHAYRIVCLWAPITDNGRFGHHDQQSLERWRWRTSRQLRDNLRYKTFWEDRREKASKPSRGVRQAELDMHEQLGDLLCRDEGVC